MFVSYFCNCRNVRTWEWEKPYNISFPIVLPTKKIFLKKLVLCQMRVLWLFKKDSPWKQVTTAGIIRCCPASVPYSLPLPPQVRQQGKKLGFFSPLQQHKVQSIYRKIGAEVISARTQQIYLYIQVHKTREVTTSSSWATRSFLFSPLSFFFFF